MAEQRTLQQFADDSVASVRGPAAVNLQGVLEKFGDNLFDWGAEQKHYKIIQFQVSWGLIWFTWNAHFKHLKQKF